MSFFSYSVETFLSLPVKTALHGRARQHCFGSEIISKKIVREIDEKQLWKHPVQWKKNICQCVIGIVYCTWYTKMTWKYVLLGLSDLINHDKETTKNSNISDKQIFNKMHEFKAVYASMDTCPYACVHIPRFTYQRWREDVWIESIRCLNLSKAAKSNGE